MSNLSNLIVFAAFFGAGFFIEPKLFRNGILSDQVTAKPSVENAQKESTTKSDTPQFNINMDLSKVLPEDFPEKVTLLKAINFSDEISGVSMNLAEGAFVKPVRINGDNLVIQPIGIPIESEIPADDTNFKQLAVPIMLARLQNATENTAPSEVPPAPEAEPKEMPSPAVSEPTSPPPENQPVVTDSVKSISLTEAEIVAKMKESILAGKVKEFVPEQISEMKMGVPAEVDGIVYEETGHIIFIAQTILGEQRNGAIALFRDGSIEKWVWAKNMLEMR